MLQMLSVAGSATAGKPWCRSGTAACPMSFDAQPCRRQRGATHHHLPVRPSWPPCPVVHPAQGTAVARLSRGARQPARHGHLVVRGRGDHRCLRAQIALAHTVVRGGASPAQPESSSHLCGQQRSISRADASMLCGVAYTGGAAGFANRSAEHSPQKAQSACLRPPSVTADDETSVCREGRSHLASAPNSATDEPSPTAQGGPEVRHPAVSFLSTVGPSKSTLVGTGLAKAHSLD